MDKVLSPKQKEKEALTKENTGYIGDVMHIFAPGELGSNTFRIPSMITTNKGTVLAAIDVRFLGGHDSPNSISPAVKRSLDGGKTWDEGQILVTYPDRASTIDASLLQDEETGRIFMLVDAFPHDCGAFQAKLGSGFEDFNEERCLQLWDEEGNKHFVKPGGRVIDSNGVETSYTIDTLNNLYKDGELVGNVFAEKCIFKVHYTAYLILMHSDDDGVTWSEPKIISNEFKEEWMGFLGTGPGRGLQIKTGKYKGRLLFPVYYLNKNFKQSCELIYSDDHGASWKMGESPNDGRISEKGESLEGKTLGENLYELTESQVVEMPNGQLKLFMRNPIYKYVAVATSFDGGETWDNNVKLDENLRDPYCQLTVINYSKKIDGKDALIFANPDADTRADGAVKIGLISENGTYENGEVKYDIEWRYNKYIDPIATGFYAYSCLTELPNGNFGLFYEGTEYHEMSFIEISPEYVMNK